MGKPHATKNGHIVFDEKDKQWKLTPAYDLTYSSSIGGEHATCVNGNGKDPNIEDLLAVGKAAGLAGSKSKKIVKEIEEIVYEELRDIMQGYGRSKSI